MSDPTAATPSGGPPAGPRAKHKRKLSNYLLDKKLQLRYVLVVTILSGLIAGALGFMIYQQRRAAANSINQNFSELAREEHDQGQKLKEAGDEAGAERRFTAEHDWLKQRQMSYEAYKSEDRQLVYKMVGVGIGLVIILSLYLVIMTHKVAGPLFKVSMYFDRMADGRLSKVTPLRQGDMLQDFYTNFKEMHEAVRARAQADNEMMDKAFTALSIMKNKADYRGEARDKLTEELDALARHVADRKAKLVDFPK